MRMIVVADTSPINYLLQIEQIHLLPMLYGAVLLPSGVWEELTEIGAPRSVEAWARNLPAWVEVRTAQTQLGPELSALGKGEAQAIHIASELHADWLLIDERRGRQEAESRGLTVTGTLGVLAESGRLHLVDPEAAYRRLVSETNFRASPNLEGLFSRRSGP
jgi:predicted nucleic acid-binding protein